RCILGTGATRALPSLLSAFAGTVLCAVVHRPWTCATSVAKRLRLRPSGTLNLTTSSPYATPKWTPTMLTRLLLPPCTSTRTWH
ncbi:hypothetical protein GGH18_001890, partial [Coemansia sp. RSA 530]